MEPTAPVLIHLLVPLLYAITWPVVGDVITTSEISFCNNDIDLNVGVRGPPVAGPENIVLFACVWNVPVSVPVVVTGEPDTVKIDGKSTTMLEQFSKLSLKFS